jgi:hypothetical protein
MLTTFEVLLNCLLILLLPLIGYSLLTGSQPPDKGWLAKYYRAERYLNLARDLFLLAICATAIARLGLHFGYIDPSARDAVELAVGVLFGATFLVFVCLWIRAALRVRRLGRSST